MLALSPQYRADASQFTTTMPPDPKDVIYQEPLVEVVVGGRRGNWKYWSLTDVTVGKGELCEFAPKCEEQ